MRAVLLEHESDHKETEPLVIDVAAAELLAAAGVSPAVAVDPPTSDLPLLVERFPLIMTVEAHYVVGGLGSLICELVAERGLSCRVVRRGFTRMPGATCGSVEYLYAAHALTRTALRDAALTALDKSMITGRTP